MCKQSFYAAQKASINFVIFVVASSSQLRTCMRMFRMKSRERDFSKLETKSCAAALTSRRWNENMGHTFSFNKFPSPKFVKNAATFRNLIEIPSMKVGQLAEGHIFTCVRAISNYQIRYRRRIEFTTTYVRTSVKEFADFDRSNSKHVKNRYTVALSSGTHFLIR